MSRFLQQIEIARYGALAEFTIGEFRPGLNVVYGPNEAGKSTVASFVGGVLFGWEEARGVRNTYRPAEGVRAGSLVFADDATRERFALHRLPDDARLSGDTNIIADLDHATYRTMFALNSDELRTLRDDSDVAERLLTASSATQSSPAAAYLELEGRIAALTSREPDADRSIFSLVDQLEQTRLAIDSAREAQALCKQEDRERAALVESRAATMARLDEANDALDELHAARARTETIETQLAGQQADLAALEAERAGFEPSCTQVELSAADERFIAEKLDEFAESQAKVQRGVDSAKENGAASKAAYEALLEVDEGEAYSANAIARRTQAIVSALLTIAFIGAGIPLFFHGRAINSLSVTALGVGLVVLACFIAAAVLAVAFRPDRRAEELATRRKDAQWIMLQDQKKLDASLEEKEALAREIDGFLKAHGLAEANGSIRQARQILDEARDARTQAIAQEQRIASLDLRIDALREAIRALEAEHAELVGEIGIQQDAPLQCIDALVREQAKQRDALVQALADMNLRFGELTQRLEAAKADTSFDSLKQRYHELQSRLRTAKRDLVKLLLAKRMLEKGMSAWESRSQPEVYAEASELLSTMTQGRWTRVSMSAEGQLGVSGPDGVVRKARHLSLGTCQQLYLSLRVAMLLHADDVGAAIPVLADDILVNFDAERRRGAAHVLAALARKRQVIVFTCHEETLDALREADPNLTCITMAR